MLPPAPVLLSTMNGWSVRSDSFWATTRATISFEPPGGYGTTILTAWLGYGSGEVPDYQMAAFCMAVFFRGLTPAETFAMTDAMV